MESAALLICCIICRLLHPTIQRKRDLLFKGALSRYSVIFCRFFCGRKWRRGDSRPRRRPTRSRPLPHFFSSVSSFAINRRRGMSQLYYPCKVIPLSDENGLFDKIKKVKTKRQVCPWKMGKIHGNQNRLAELHGSILSCLCPKIVQDSRGFQVQLRIFRYTVQCTLR